MRSTYIHRSNSGDFLISFQKNILSVINDVTYCFLIFKGWHNVISCGALKIHPGIFKVIFVKIYKKSSIWSHANTSPLNKIKLLQGLLNLITNIIISLIAPTPCELKQIQREVKGKTQVTNILNNALYTNGKESHDTLSKKYSHKNDDNW